MAAQTVQRPTGGIMRTWSWLGLGVVLATRAAFAQSPALESPCPPAIRLPEALLPAGSEMLSSTVPPSRLTLVSVEYSDGHPRDKAFLAPSGHTRESGRNLTVHDFGPGRAPWISCSYSDGGKYIKFTRPLGPVHRCEGRSAPGEAPLVSCVGLAQPSPEVGGAPLSGEPALTVGGQRLVCDGEPVRLTMFLALDGFGSRHAQWTLTERFSGGARYPLVLPGPGDAPWIDPSPKALLDFMRDEAAPGHSKLEVDAEFQAVCSAGGPALKPARTHHTRLRRFRRD